MESQINFFRDRKTIQVYLISWPQIQMQQKPEASTPLCLY